jgi:hypothetical protein
MYDWTEDMDNLTPEGGQPELDEREMVKRGCEWLDAHPRADIQIRHLAIGVMMEDSQDAKDLVKHMTQYTDYPVYRLTYNAVLEVLWIKRYGWDAFRQDLRVRKRMEGVQCRER